MTGVDAIADQINSMPESQIAPIAEQALGGAEIDRELSRTARPLNAVSTGVGTVGLWRVSGEVVSKGEKRSWSSVLKILNRELSGFTSSLQGAAKEIAAVESGDLLSIDAGIRPVPTFGFATHDDGNFWLWMRDMSDAVHPPWDGDQHVEAARRVGQFNYLWTESDRPQGEWITTDMSTDRRSAVSGLIGPQLATLESYREHPHVRRLTENVGLERILKLPDEVTRIIASTVGMERTVAHNDCHARNLFPGAETGERVTYAIDWASTGLGPVGVDGGSLAGADVTWSQPEAAVIEGYEGEIFAAYVQGLRESGWDGDESHVRLAYLSQFVTYIMFFPFITLVNVLPEHPRREFLTRRLGVGGEEAVAQVSSRLPMFIHLVDEALELAN